MTATSLGSPLPPARLPAAIYWLVGGSVAIVHLILFGLDAVDGSGFMRADRATQRFNAIQNLLAARTHAAFVESLVRQGNIGDYGIHAWLYGWGGALTVSGFQIVLAVASAVCVAYIAWRAFGAKSLALASGLLYGFLPQSLAFPHQLLSEAMANPFVIFGTAGVLYALEAPPSRTSPSGRWLTAGLLMGVGGLVRPALILLPLIAAGLLLLFDKLGLQPRLRAWQPLLLALGGVAPFVLWGLFMLANTGKFGPGESHQDLGINFSQSTAKVLLNEGVAPKDGSTPAWLPERLTLKQYFGYMKSYPKGFANLYIKNTLVMVTDSGMGRLYVDLLGFGADARLQLQDPVNGWRAQLTNHGPWAMLKTGWRVAPGTILAGVLGAAGFCIVNIGLLAAYVALLRPQSPLTDPARPLSQRWCSAFLLIVPIYVLVTSQVVAYAPSRLRSQAEFAWAMLACFGWTVLRNYLRRSNAARH